VLDRQYIGVGIGVGLAVFGRKAGSMFLEIAGILIAACAWKECGAILGTRTTKAVGPMKLSFSDKKKMRPRRAFANRPASNRLGPPEQGSVGLPTGQRQGVTTSLSLVNLGVGVKKIPQSGALQFGVAPMGARKRTVNT